MQEKICFRAQSSLIAISVGGTFGHINPALHLASAAKENCFLIGIGLKDSPFLKDAEVETISLDGARKVWQLLKSCWQAFFLFQRKNPKIVVCFGSFHSFPATIVGLLLGKAIWVFEPNAKMGKVNRFFAFFAHKILCYDEKLVAKYPHRGVLIAPSLKKKNREESLQFFQLQGKKPVLLVIGGSSGAASLNQWIEKHLEECKKYELIHLIGPAFDKEKVKTLYQQAGVEAFVDTFITNADQAMMIADVAISRGGASTLSELNFYQVPTVIVPFEGAYQHQLENGKRFLESGGIGKIVRESVKEEIFPVLETLLGQKGEIREFLKGDAWSTIISSV